ncbi:hypothetical protein DW192_06285 [Segatella copri]|uniref:Uncharacterized protein n=1 Tax=Segatella copri TaxID=165179 RepID=A0A3R6I9I7_9BACT|nr:hypothetical protein DW192_06285 [Segatella copri]
MRLKALNHCKNNQNFLFIIIITRIFQGFSKKKLYFCIKKAALGNLKAAFIALICIFFAERFRNKNKNKNR